MKVEQLIEKLRTLDGDAEVVVANYEFGFDALTQVHVIEAVKAQEGEAEFVMSSAAINGSKRINIICLGPCEPSRLEIKPSRQLNRGG
jgi:hypothetical protein